MGKCKIYSVSISVDMFEREVVILITNSKGFLYNDIENILSEDLGMQDYYAKELSKGIRETLNEEKLLYPGLTVTITTSNGNSGIFCIFKGSSPKTIKKEVIIHEMYHAMYSICKEAGINDEETMAYMLEYLCKRFFEIADNFGKKDKKS